MFFVLFVFFIMNDIIDNFKSFINNPVSWFKIKNSKLMT